MSPLVQVPLNQWGTINEPWHLPCGIYVVEELGGPFVKVGIANHPIRRFPALQTGNPRLLVLRAIFCGPREICRAVERRTHLNFAKVRNEWLRAEVDDVIEFIGGQT